MDYEINSCLLGGGLILGLIFGSVIQKSGFCMSAVISNIVLMRDYRQFHAFLIAVSIAVIGTQLLSYSGLVDITESAYLSVKMNWSGAIVGGVIFGFGTILAGGCIGKTVVRVGEGNIGAVMSLLVMAFAAAITMYGPLEHYRVWLYQETVFEIPFSLSTIPGMLNLSIGLFVMIFVFVCFSIIHLTAKKNRSQGLQLAGLILGLTIVAGWWVTGCLSQDLFSLHRPSSLTYAGPLASSSYMLVTGNFLSDNALFGVTLLIGTLIGSFLMAVCTGHFRWVKPDSDHIHHILLGGGLMGVGAIVAGGCNIGNGLTGISVLSVRSLLALMAIFSGMRIGIFWLMRSEMSERQSHWYSLIYNLNAKWMKKRELS